ncbi:hypothetical protein OUZ56_001195 [Daphnia magna]|uniref:Uncharacterized protein n=1 Tax=Daphnia magna TaxID=35525 RepID=A0ABR0A221_9CRUS|nr:hypothetical protein OUZ56_001195 [Daphnia magna]
MRLDYVKMLWKLAGLMSMDFKILCKAEQIQQSGTALERRNSLRRRYANSKLQVHSKTEQKMKQKSAYYNSVDNNILYLCVYSFSPLIGLVEMATLNFKKFDKT